ncbi:hypothetical protein M0804_004512 [Polistes exclamans]|nr:hypothetical protein M0804_004512 [Polistes exclamans]
MNPERNVGKRYSTFLPESWLQWKRLGRLLPKDRRQESVFSCKRSAPKDMEWGKEGKLDKRSVRTESKQGWVWERGWKRGRPFRWWNEEEDATEETRRRKRRRCRLL